MVTSRVSLLLRDWLKFCRNSRFHLLRIVSMTTKIAKGQRVHDSEIVCWRTKEMKSKSCWQYWEESMKQGMIENRWYRVKIDWSKSPWLVIEKWWFSLVTYEKVNSPVNPPRYIKCILLWSVNTAQKIFH